MLGLLAYSPVKPFFAINKQSSSKFYVETPE